MAGSGTNDPAGGGDGGPSKQAQLSAVTDVAVGPDNNFYIADFQNFRIRKVTPTLPGYSENLVIAAEDGSELYVFDRAGRHLRTLNALTGALRYQFDYDNSGLLKMVTDGDNNITTIERDSDGTAKAIVGPFGQRTVLTPDANGYLASIKNPNNESVKLTYTVDGLLQTLIDANNNPPYQFDYDTLGRLKLDKNPEGGFKTLSRLGQPGALSARPCQPPASATVKDTFNILLKSALGRNTTYQVSNYSNGDQQRVNTFLDTLHLDTLIQQNGTTRTCVPDGTLTTTTVGGDPRWKMQVPLLKSLNITTPGLVAANVTRDRSATPSDPAKPLSVETNTLKINGRTYTSAYTAATKTFTDTTPVGRASTTTIDAQGRIVGQQFANLDPAIYHYDPRGRLDTATRGTGATARPFSFTYNQQVPIPVPDHPEGFLDKITDPMTREVSFSYDLAGRIKTQTLPDLRVIGFTYDANGNLFTITPPGRPAHTFHYTKVDLIHDYTPPDLGDGAKPIVYDYNPDRQLSQISRADGALIVLGYEPIKGRLSTITTPTRGLTIAYDPSTGTLSSITAPNVTVSYTFDGALLKDTIWTGAVLNKTVNPTCCSVNRTYNNNFLLKDETVNNDNAALIKFFYDNDNLLTNAGDLTITRDPQNGLPRSTLLGSVTDSRNFNTFGELDSYSASFGNSPLFSVQYPNRDKLGRITRKVETIGGVTDVYDYTYYEVGRLKDVFKNENVTPVAHYDYDPNGNRLPGTYDAQDRLKESGGFTYDYTLDGELLTQTKTSSGEITKYEYDAFGNLLSVTLPSNSKVEYIVDGIDRRVEKKFKGVIQRFLYRDRVGPIAELDGNNKIVSRFIYGTRPNVPDYMIKNGVTYRIITDHLGSPRLVVDIATGAIAQRMDYDEFGKVTFDNKEGFQPFGFAGGLYDPDTRLVRFGVRDYDAVTGRWTTKDPLLFGGREMNLYTYVANDPINLIDPTGTDFWSAASWFAEASAWGIVGGVVITAALGSATIVGGLVAAGLIAYGTAELGLEIAELVAGVDRTGQPLSGEDRIDIAAGIAGGSFNSWGYATGHEFKVPLDACKGPTGKPMSIAPWGNRTGHEFGEFPHYHRGVPNPSKPGQSLPGQAYWRHRPYEGGW